MKEWVVVCNQCGWEMNAETKEESLRIREEHEVKTGHTDIGRIQGGHELPQKPL